MLYYYIKHYNKIPLDLPFQNPKIIPDIWYKYSRQDVDAATKKSAIKEGFEKWVNWETSTKVLYERMYKELINLNEIAGAGELNQYIKDVDEELSRAKQKHIELKSIDFDLFNIVAEQEEKYKKYKKKLREMDIC